MIKPAPLRRLASIASLASTTALAIACSSVSEEAAQSHASQASDVSGVYALVAVHSGKCVDDPNWSTDNGTVAQQWDCNGTQANQEWAVSTLGSGKQLRSVHSGKCLDVSNWSADNGAFVQQWDCSGNTNQTWEFIARPGGYALKSAFSGKCLDVSGVSVANGAQLQQWDCSNGANQTFALTPRAAGGLAACTGAQRARCNCPSSFSCCSTDGSCFASSDQIVYTMCKDDPGSACSMTGGATSPPPPPPPPPPPSPPGSTRLRVTNRCAQPIWLAHSDNVPDAQNVRLATGQSHDVSVPDGALSATRFWPKTGCDGAGHHCAMGDNGEGGGKPCPATGCQPPLDSKFEVSFAAKGSNAQTWYNLSQVDGYTLPFKVVPAGAGAERGSCVSSDCSRLSLAACPGDENMSGGGQYPAYAHEDLRVRDGNGQVIACMAPCKKWNYPAPYGLGQDEGADPGLHLCCPTPINPATGQCTVANRCMSSPSCSNAGDPASVVHTSYVAAIHSMCPSAYSYAYDDAAGLHACPSDTSFDVVFCP